MQKGNCWRKNPAHDWRGGAAASANHAAQVTWGQTSVGQAESESFRAALGYWHEMEGLWRVRLPWVGKEE